MTKLYKPLSIFAFLLVFASCSDDDPLPVPLVNFFLDPEVVEVGVEVMFDNLSTNAARYEWDFGDGQVVEDISPSVTFTTPGAVTVTLRAYTEDNQVDSLSKNFTVRERILTGYVLNIFPISNNGSAWDPNETGVDQLPDLIVQFFPDDPDNTSGFVDGIFTNVPTGPIFNSFNFDDVDPIVLGDDDWTFVLFDFDGDIDDIQPEDFEFMTGAQFNPIQAATFKNDQGDGGFITVLLVDNLGNVLDVDFTFELR